MDRFCIAIDIGAGLGVKMGLFADPHHQIDEGLLRCDEYENNFDCFVRSLLARLDQLLQKERPADERGPGHRHRLAGAVPLRRQLPAGGEPALPLRPEPQTPDRRRDRPAHGHRQRRQPGRAGRMVRRADRPVVLGLRRRLGRGLDRQDRPGPLSRRRLGRRRPEAPLHERAGLRNPAEQADAEGPVLPVRRVVRPLRADRGRRPRHAPTES